MTQSIPRRAAVRSTALTVAAVLLSACTNTARRIAGSGAPAGARPTSAGSAVVGTVARIIRVDELTTGLTTPWGLAFLPDGAALITERDTARIKLVRPRGTGSTVDTVGTVRGVEPAGEGGLLGIVAAPDVTTSKRLLVYYTSAGDNRIATLTWDGGRVTGQQDVFTGIPKASFHNGGRMAFGPDGLLYVGTGDAGNRDAAQDVTAPGGKILRLRADGSPAPDNPFPTAPTVFSLGHRNVQGLAFDPQGRLWATEFGQDTFDELNLVKAGDNGGWPIVEGPSDDARFAGPQRSWPTDQASPSGIAIAGGSVWMAALRGRRLWQIPLAGDGTAEPISLLENKYGRLRTVVVAPDGALWLTTSNTDGRGSPTGGDDRILRVSLG